MMTEVKPWEPVLVRYFDKEAMWLGQDWPFDSYDWDTLATMAPNWEAGITLANSQRVIVRALSEERKAARAMRKRVNKAVEANR